MEEAQPSQFPQLVNATPSTANSSKSKVIPIILGITAIIVIAIGAYVLGTKHSQPVIQNAVQPTPIPSPVPTIDETANWKTLKFNDYEIKYPLDKYSYRNGPSNINALWPGVVLISPNDSFSGYEIEISVVKNDGNLTVGNPKDMFLSKMLPNTVCEYEANSNKQIDTIDLGGKKAFKMSNCGGVAGTKEQIVTVVNNRLYEITVEPLDQGSLANGVLTQILATFKFLDK